MRKSNIPVYIYLALNVVLVCAVVWLYVQEWWAIPIGISVYAVSLSIALSPVGEWILRFQTGCKKIKRREYQDYLYPLFQDVYDRARKLEPSIAADIQLYINDDEEANAFATGRKTICVTKGLLNLPPEQVKATLGHEFGHLVHKDTDLILLVSVGNMLVNAIIIGIKIIIEIVHVMFLIAAFFVGGEHSLLGTLLIEFYHLLIWAFVAGLSWIWTKIGVLLVMKSSRSNEYEADAFSYQLGYGDDLCAALDAICGPGAKGLFANLVSSHPDKDDRIARMQELGSSYRVQIGNLALDGSKKVLEEKNNKQSKIQKKLKTVPARLKCISGEYTGAEIPIQDKNPVIIGKNSAVAHIILSNSYISGNHCSIRYDADRKKFVVTDTSTNGTYLENGTKLPKNVDSFLPEGSIILLGNGSDRFQLLGESSKED